MHQAGVQQFTDHIAWPASRLKLIHVGTAIGVDPAEQRHHIGEGRKVVPINYDASRTRHRHPVNQVVGRSTRGKQRHHGIHNAALVDQLANSRLGC